MVVQVVRYSDSIDHSALRCQERLPTASCHVRKKARQEASFRIRSNSTKVSTVSINLLIRCCAILHFVDCQALLGLVQVEGRSSLTTGALRHCSTVQ